MKSNNLSITSSVEETLDPSDWDGLNVLGKEMIDDMIGFLQTIRDQPVWRKPTDEAKEQFGKKLPRSPQPFSEVYEEFKTNILPHYLGNIHPRFWGWVMGTGSAQGMLADMLAAGMNANVTIGDHAPMYIDQQVIEWCKEMMSFPADSSGMLVSGASVANLNALIVARNYANEKIRKNGMTNGRRMVMYASSETHSAIQKAAEIIGIGSDGVRKVRVNDKYEMDVVHLEKLIEQDREEGNIPFCVVANIGTVNTGAIDPLEKIFWICCKENLWLHVDGAFGALLKLLPEYDEQLMFLGFADSIAFDLHKWMYMPYEAGVVLVNDGKKHKASFELQPDYIMNLERGLSAGPENISNFGIDLSRNFKALKVWMLLKEQGIEKYSRLIRQNLEQARFLEEKIKSTDHLQLMAPVATNIVCFRYVEPGISDDDLNDLNKEVLMQLHEAGIAAPSYTRLKGNFAIRVAIANHRSVKKDFELLVDSVLSIGKKLTGKSRKEKLVA